MKELTPKQELEQLISIYEKLGTKNRLNSNGVGYLEGLKEANEILHPSKTKKPKFKKGDRVCLTKEAIKEFKNNIRSYFPKNMLLNKSYTIVKVTTSSITTDEEDIDCSYVVKLNNGVTLSELWLIKSSVKIKK